MMHTAAVITVLVASVKSYSNVKKWNGPFMYLEDSNADEIQEALDELESYKQLTFRLRKTKCTGQSFPDLTYLACSENHMTVKFDGTDQFCERELGEKCPHRTSQWYCNRIVRTRNFPKRMDFKELDFKEFTLTSKTNEKDSHNSKNENLYNNHKMTSCPRVSLSYCPYQMVMETDKVNGAYAELNQTAAYVKMTLNLSHSQCNTPQTITLLGDPNQFKNLHEIHPTETLWYSPDHCKFVCFGITSGGRTEAYIDGLLRKFKLLPEKTSIKNLGNI